MTARARFVSRGWEPASAEFLTKFQTFHVRKSMKICHVAVIYLPGILPGCSKYAQDISTGFIGRGHSVTVLTAHAISGRGWVDPLWGQYSSKKEETIEGVRVKR